jgi:alkylation response protein AidB-like acyl-CoA dehydrogenase
MLEARAASQAIQHTLREGDDEQLACKKAARNEAFMQSSMDAIHTFGGYGYLRECEVEVGVTPSVARCTPVPRIFNAI